GGCRTPLGLERQLEAHSASSPVDSGGISAGALVGSKVRLVKATGCLLMIAAGACPGRGDDRARQVSQPKRSAPRNTQRMINRDEDNAASGFDFPNKTEMRP